MNYDMDALRVISHELATQNNRITEAPIFAVQEKVRDLGYCDEDYAEGSEWRDLENDFSLPESDEEEAGLEVKLEAGEDTGGFEKFFYRDRYEFVQPFFTEKAAQRYIDTNAHNLNEPRIYAYGSYRNHEWQSVRDYISALPPKTGDTE